MNAFFRRPSPARTGLVFAALLYSVGAAVDPVVHRYAGHGAEDPVPHSSSPWEQAGGEEQCILCHTLKGLALPLHGVRPPASPDAPDPAMAQSPASFVPASLPGARSRGPPEV